MRYRLEIGVCFFLILGNILVFHPLRNANFISYDDPTYVNTNPYVNHGWTTRGLRWAFTTTVHGHWHPLTWLSHMTDCQLFGLNPAAHHMVSLLFHIMNSVLLFLALRTMTGALLPSAIVASLFAFHPLHVESVAWISDRKDLLNALFWILTLLAYNRYVKAKGLFNYLLILLPFCLGLMTKSMIVTLPCVLLLLDYWPLNRMPWRWKSPVPRADQQGKLVSEWKSFLKLFVEKIPLFILVGILAWVTLTAMETQITNHVPVKRALFSSLPLTNATVFYSIYILKMFWPMGLAIPYSYRGLPVQWESLASIALLGALFFLAILWRNKRPYFFVGWFWFVITLLPVIGILKFGPHEIADRYTYIPLIGLFMAIVWTLADVLKSWHYAKMLYAPAFACITIVLMVLSFVQAHYWKDNITLFSHTVRVTKNNYRAHNDLGVALEKAGRLEEAIMHLETAIRIKPDAAKSHYSLGLAFGKKGDLFQAIVQLSKTLEIQPDNPFAHYDLAVALSKLGKFSEAIPHFRHALRLNPNYPPAHNGLGIALAMTGNLEDAIEEFNKAIHLDPNYEKAKENLRQALYSLKQKKTGSPKN